MFCDGEELFAFRSSCDANSPSLYLSNGASQGHHVLASEPLDGKAQGWCLVPENSFVRISSNSAHIESL